MADERAPGPDRQDWQPGPTGHAPTTDSVGDPHDRGNERTAEGTGPVDPLYEQAQDNRDGGDR